MGVFQNNLMGAAAAAASAGGGDFYSHQITNSLRNSASQDGTLKFTAGTPTSSTTMTMSYWVKRYTTSNSGADNNIFVTGTGGGTYIILGFHDGNTWNMQVAGGNWGSGEMKTNALYRDTAGWYHHVLRIDTTESTQSNRVRWYVNGEQITSFNTEGITGNLSSSESISFINQSGVVQAFGGLSGKGHGTEGAELQMAEIVFCDGQSYGPDSFGETKNGVWIPKDPSGLTFGNNGYYLKFESSSDLGNDSSGNNNDFTVANFSAHDQMTDTPTNNFCTLNPVYRGEDTTDAKYGTLTEGNLKISYVNNQDASCPCTIKVPASGKWYFEYLINAGGGTGDYSPAAGIFDPNEYTYNTSAYNAVGSIQYANNVNKVYKGTSVAGTYGGSRGSNGDVMGIAVDMDNGAFYVSKNGTFQTISGGSQGDPTSGSSKTGAGATWTPASEFTSGMVPLGAPNGGNVPIITMNFGQDGTFAGEKTAGGNSDENGHGNFFSAVPSGYSAICTGALTVASEVDPAQTSDDYPQKLFSPILYTGNGSSRSITGLGFQPDWTWLKNRETDTGQKLYDSSRGAGKVVYPHNTDAEATISGLSAFDSDGFSIGSTATGYNDNNDDFVAWNLRANGGTETTNNTGTQTSYTQTDPSGGFSIVRYAGTGSSMTVGHGLSVEPKLTIIKDRDASVNWIVYTKVIDGSLDYLFLDSHVAAADSGLTGPNSSIWNFNSASSYSNTSGRNYIMYNFTNIEGFLKVGTYGGNGDTDGTFVYTGFRPAWVMIKAIDTGAEWTIYDNKRDPFNESDHVLQADIPDAERTDLDEIDIVSNGFKCLSTGGRTNQSGKNYVFLAFAKNPFKYATAR